MIVDRFVNLLKGTRKGTTSRAPGTRCPNCWGEQEYDNILREIPKDKQVDVNNHVDSHAFIKKFMVNRIDGIHLRRDMHGVNGYECTTCHEV